MAAALPPAFIGHDLLYMGAVFSRLLTMMLALEWVWRTVWCFFEKPAPLRAPVTALRVIYLLLLLAAMIRLGPDLVLLMTWPTISPEARQALATLDNYLDVGAFVPFSLAWLFARLANPMISYQLEKQPLPLHLWPTKEQLKRPAKIGLGVFAIAFILTYLR